MLKNVIFDMGNVMLRFDFDRLLGTFYKGEHYDFLKNRIFSNWDLMDDGRMSHEEYKKAVTEGLSEPEKTAAENVLEKWEEVIEPVPEMETFVKDLKSRGFKIFILSNIPMHFVERQSMFPVLKEFDGKVFSGEVKLMKPNKEIFDYLLDTYSLKPEECLFVDDTEINVKAAESYGIKSFLFDKYGKNLNRLKKLIASLS